MGSYLVSVRMRLLSIDFQVGWFCALTSTCLPKQIVARAFNYVKKHYDSEKEFDRLVELLAA